MNKLEVIAWSVEDAIRIEQGGADRIELVVDLDKGGLTPPITLVQEVVNAVDIPVRVMIRDTWQDYVYPILEMEQYALYLHALQLVKPEGIVFGSLTPDGKINFEQLEMIIKYKGKLKLTFHRAFDDIKNEETALEEFNKLSKYDVDTLLTSGLKGSALEGAGFIKKLISKNLINILPGKSIDLTNYKQVLKETKSNYIHVGYAVRDKEGNIDIEKIKQMKEGLNND